mgnify:CR=1 FL=1|jgi:hypothetical protein
MAKLTLGPKPLIYPMPALIVGSNIDGKGNRLLWHSIGIRNR